METFSKTVAAFLAILFIGTTVLTLALYNVEKSAFDAELYIRAMDDENIYQRVPELTAQSLAVAAQRAGDNSLMSIFKNLSGDDWRRFVSELFPPEVLRTLAEDGVNQFIAYINGERDNVILSLAGLKAHLNSPEGINAIYGLVQSQPDCTVEQLTTMAMGGAGFVLCNPPESFLFIDLRPIYEQQIRAAVGLIPEQVTLVTTGPDRAQQVQDLRFTRAIIRLTPVLPVLCLFMLTLFAVRSIGDWLNWWGYPFLLAGLFSMFLGALSGPIAAVTFQLFIAPVLPDALPQEIVNVFRDLTGRIVGNTLQPTLLIAGVIMFCGLIMVTLAFLLRKRLQPRQRYIK